jgi:hypothetical protein
VGAGWMRNTPGDGVTYRSQYLRFAPQTTFKRWFYVGAALEFGKIYASSGMLDGQLPSTCSGNPNTGLTCTAPGNNLVDESGGTVVEPQVFVGVRDLVGLVSGSFEIAPTVRWTTASTTWLNQTFTTTVATVELHGRMDVWLMPRISAGIMVGSDFNTLRDLQAGLQVGFHFDAYDGMKGRGL